MIGTIVWEKRRKIYEKPYISDYSTFFLTFNKHYLISEPIKLYQRLEKNGWSILLYFNGLFLAEAKKSVNGKLNQGVS